MPKPAARLIAPKPDAVGTALNRPRIVNPFIFLDNIFAVGRNRSQGRPLRPAGAAIPGSRSAALLASVGSRWAERLTSLEADFRRHANALKVAATQYEVNDAEAAAAFDASYAGSLSSWAYR